MNPILYELQLWQYLIFLFVQKPSSKKIPWKHFFLFPYKTMSFKYKIYSILIHVLRNYLSYPDFEEGNTPLQNNFQK